MMLRIEVSFRCARGSRSLIACLCLNHEGRACTLRGAGWLASGAAGSSSSSLYVCIRAVLLPTLLVLVSVPALLLVGGSRSLGLVVGPCCCATLPLSPWLCCCAALSP